MSGLKTDCSSLRSLLGVGVRTDEVGSSWYVNLPVASPRRAARPMPSSERFHVSKEREHAGHPSFVSPCHMASRNARPTRAQVNGGGQECPPLHDLGGLQHSSFWSGRGPEGPLFHAEPTFRLLYGLSEDSSFAESAREIEGFTAFGMASS